MRTLVTFCDVCGQMMPIGEPVPMTLVMRTLGEKDPEKVVTTKADICPRCSKTLLDAMSGIQQERA